MSTQPLPNSFTRREFMRTGALGTLGFCVSDATVRRASAGVGVGALPTEPLEIGTTPQFLFDLYVVDTTWSLKPKGEPVRRIFHTAKKHLANPLMTGDDPSHLWILREPDGQFRMWYQANVAGAGGAARYGSTVAYAQSKDGVTWEKPALDLFPEAAPGTLPRNAVLFRPDAPQCHPGAPQILDVPEADRRGYRYLMFHTMSKAPLNGLRLIGSHDGIHWDPKSDTRIAALPSDTHNTIVHDPRRGEYVMFCRSKHIYHAIGQTHEMLSSGESRRGMSRLSSHDLWSPWDSHPQTILMPDERDADLGYNYFMGMPVQRTADVWWGALAPFLWNDLYACELAWSRDGIHWERSPERKHLIEFGPAGSWDQSMVVGNPQWVEVGDEWWLYYGGWDGPHDSTTRKGGIGLATIRKEGFVSQHGPKTGGVVCTRVLRWPGGGLLVNADAQHGELRARFSDELRRPITGFDYADSAPFAGDSTTHEMTWSGTTMDVMKGKLVRLEFLLKEAEIFTFRAKGGGEVKVEN